MKKHMIIIFAICLLIVSGLVLLFLKTQFNSSFATDISLKFKYNNKNIDEKISDVSVITELKSILQGTLHTDSPSCGFSTNVSIKLSNGEKTVVLSPALDGCPIIRIDESNKYIKISNEDREKLDDILKKYGFIFPCI